MPADLTVLPARHSTDPTRATRGDTRAKAGPRARPAQPNAEPELSPADAGKAVAAANDQLKQIDSELAFQLDNATGLVVVKLIDRNTREVLRQVPSKEALAIAQALAEGGGTGKIVKANA